MNDCIEKLSALGDFTYNEYFIYKFDNDSAISEDSNLFANIDINREKYHDVATMCVNLELKNGFNLVAQSDVLYCESNYYDERAELGWLITHFSLFPTV